MKHTAIAKIAKDGVSEIDIKECPYSPHTRYVILGKFLTGLTVYLHPLDEGKYLWFSRAELNGEPSAYLASRTAARELLTELGVIPVSEMVQEKFVPRVAA